MILKIDRIENIIPLLSRLGFVIFGFIKNFLPNSYFILQIYHSKSYKIRHVTSLYFNFSVWYLENRVVREPCKRRSACIRKRRSVLKRGGGCYFLSFVALLSIFFQIFISYCKFIMSKALKWYMLHLCTLIFH